MGALFRGSLGKNRVLWGLYLAGSDSKPADSGREPERKAPWGTELGRWIRLMALKGVYLKRLVKWSGANSGSFSNFLLLKFSNCLWVRMFKFPDQLLRPGWNASHNPSFFLSWLPGALWHGPSEWCFQLFKIIQAMQKCLLCARPNKLGFLLVALKTHLFVLLRRENSIPGGALQEWNKTTEGIKKKKNSVV